MCLGPDVFSSSPTIKSLVCYGYDCSDNEFNFRSICWKWCKYFIWSSRVLTLCRPLCCLSQMVRMSVLADCLKTISNAEKRGRRQVLIRPSSKVVVKFLQKMQEHGKDGMCGGGLCPGWSCCCAVEVDKSRARSGGTLFRWNGETLAVAMVEDLICSFHSSTQSIMCIIRIGYHTHE